MFNLRCHKCSEPPGHDLSPQCGMHYVESFQVLLVPENYDKLILANYTQQQPTPSWTTVLKILD